MAGNTRGKLKEHMEGIHRNFDWIVHHINSCLQLIDTNIRSSSMIDSAGGDEEKIQAIVDEYPLYQGIKSLGEGVQTLDELAQGVYEKL